MFASSILHVCVFLVSFGIIKHLKHAGSGNMKIYSPTSIIFPEATPEGNMILLDKYIFIFPSPACNKCIMYNIKIAIHNLHWQYSSIFMQ
jgi:hypothetical protein